MPRRCLFATAAIMMSLASTHTLAAPSVLSEGFDDVQTVLSGGWTVANRGTAGGITDWYQGEDGVFAAQSGPANAYIAANYNSAPLGGVISTWLITPDLALGTGGASLSFWTRSAGDGYADHLKVLFNGTGGTAATDFTTVLFDINAAELPDGYPTEWTQFALNFQPLGMTHGSLAFVYSQSNADNANYIGLDTVAYAALTAPTAISEPAAWSLIALALAGLAVSGRRHTPTSEQ